MYEFLADPECWKHSRKIDECFDKIEIKYDCCGYEISMLPNISWEEVQAIQVPKTIVYQGLKPVYVILTRKFPLCCWIKIKDGTAL
jgi:hypothetical protein